MILSAIDWFLILLFFVLSLGIGIWAARSGNRNSKDYFNASGKMPWWLLGVSMVATTFSTDTPNLVTNIVRQQGVYGNWAWWAFLLTGMLTVFVYARLWKKTGVLTDVEFYELRYSGKAARFLRGFRAIYLGLVFNVMIMAAVSLAVIKIGGVLLGLTPLQTVVVAGTVTVLYSSIGGLRGVIVTDFIQFFLSIGGAVIAAIVALQHPKVGGLTNMLNHENVVSKLDLFPSFSNPEIFATILLIQLLVQWWSVWYPGSEPGGGGYIAQRMFAAKDEQHSMKAVFFFNAAHYALRPWPWIIVALCSLIVYPDLESLRLAFPEAAGIVSHDLGYPAMLTFIPHGLLGLVVTSLIAAYMSTISTHLNWGASYIANDYYKRFLKPSATEKELLNVGRLVTVILMVLTMVLALLLENALDAFQILLQIGAGTGLIFILRWFWWRVNAASELAAMLISFAVALYFGFVHQAVGLSPLPYWQELVIGIGITTIGWVSTSYLTQPTSLQVMTAFINKVDPGGPGWEKVIIEAKAQGLISYQPVGQWKIPIGILCMILGTVAIYSFLMGTGLIIYQRLVEGFGLLLLTIITTTVLKRLWNKII